MAQGEIVYIQTASGLFVASASGAGLAEHPGDREAVPAGHAVAGEVTADHEAGAAEGHGEEHHEHGGVFHYPLKLVEQSTGIAVPEFAVWGWVIALAIALLGKKAGDRIQRLPKRDLSGFFELCVGGISGIAESFIGPGYQRHVPFVGSLFIFILCCNFSGLIPGIISPTGAMGPNAETYGLNTTIALGLCAFVYLQYQGFKQNGTKYLMHFVGEPWWLFPLNLPIHIIGEIAKPLSLAVRLFGNIGGEDKVLFVLGTMTLASIPLHWPLSMFCVFTGFLQAFVFTGLVCAYLEGVAPHHEEAEGH